MEERTGIQHFIQFCDYVASQHRKKILITYFPKHSKIHTLLALTAYCREEVANAWVTESHHCYFGVQVFEDNKKQRIKYYRYCYAKGVQPQKQSFGKLELVVWSEDKQKKN